MAGYPPEALYREMAFLAYYLHWDQDTLLNMEHRERQRWCAEVSAINRKISGEKEKSMSIETLK